ncbi:AAA family ATPase [Saprospira sp. CCB-QB6]|uniref:AAA family ATPase n=1 Tax=Saprospira sp. CCB-QB6 TaxID=3023936 RepID=UPI002349F2B6|nr:AAA family ATPase [Saprospira sp. CCB-QB6]WCL82052.1 AAA family ATPase [Saprospira sp. CCB-QB6]
MEHLSLFGIKNFRVFDDKEGFLEELAPITLITGANNSGKSSILKALIMLEDSINKYRESSVFDLEFSGDRHFLGDINNVLFEKTDHGVTISLPFPFLSIKSLFTSLTFSKTNAYQATLSKISIHDKLEDVEVFSAEYKKVDKEESEADWEVNKAEYDNDRQTYDHFIGFLEGYIHWNIDWKYFQENLTIISDFYTKYREHWTEDYDKKSMFSWGVDIFDLFLSDKFDSKQEQLDANRFNLKSLMQFLKKKECVDDLKTIIDGTLSKEKSGVISVRTKDFEPMLEAPTEGKILFFYLRKIINSEFTLDVDSDMSSNLILDAFDKAWSEIFSLFKRSVYLSANRGDTSRIYFETNSSFRQTLLDYDRYVESNRFSLFEPFIEKWLREFDIADSLFIKSSAKYGYSRVEVVYKDGTKRDLIDFGYGVMNLIIIFIQIEVLAVKNYNFQDNYQPSIFFLEEPETNLHPKWQSLLAEVFWEASQKFNIQFLIETHSEYLIRRFQTLVVKDKGSSENVKILYLRNPKHKAQGKKQVESIAIEKDGSIDYGAFDSGFFDEHDNLELSLLNIQRETKLKQLEDGLDEYVNKNNIQNYLDEIDRLLGVDKTKVLPTSITWLATAKHMFANFGNSYPDYSAIAVQCGRIIEAELKCFFENCKNLCTGTSYSHTTTPDSLVGWGFMIQSYEVAKNKNGDPLLRWHQSLSSGKLGNLAMWDTLALLLQYPGIISHANLPSNGFLVVRNELNTKFKDPNRILNEDFLARMRFLIDKRDGAAHTYASPVSYEEAQSILQYIEEFIDNWVVNKK